MSDRSNKLPLDGLRVIDLGTAWAAPICAKLLALNGAEVIHVENFERPDVNRFGDYPDNKTAEHDFWETGGRYHGVNANKMGLGIKLDHPEGVKWFKELVKRSDVVVENFAPRVMANFGLGYTDLSAIRPEIIMLSMSAFGHDGPWANYKGYGPVTEATSGVAHLSGRPDRPPTISRIVYADPPSSMMGYFAVVTALYQRFETGKGTWIDLSQYEVLASFVGEAILKYNISGDEETRRGNRHSFMAPHGCYRCQGIDKWITIAISTEEEWQRLCNAMSNPPWTKEPRFATNGSRFENQDELDKLIEAWTVGKDNREMTQSLQRQGITAGAVLNSKEILLDKHLRDRQCFQTVDYSETRKGLGVGKRIHLGLPWKMSGMASSIVRPAPRLGQDNHKILVEMLGATEEEFAELRAQGVIGDKPPPTLAKASGLLGAIPHEMRLKQGAIAGYDLDYKEQLGI